MMVRSLARQRRVHSPFYLVLLPFVMIASSVAGGPAEDNHATGEVLNLFDAHKDDYAATEKPGIVVIGVAKYLTITGQGEPGGSEFQKKMGALYSIAYGLKMKSKFAGRDYMVAPVEGLWWGSKENHDFFDEPRETWNWKLIIRTPDFITNKDLKATTGRAAKPPGTKEVKLESIAEGKCVQILHIGPYDQETENINKMLNYAKEKGLAPSGPHHEIYVSDPNRVAPDKMKTILRQPVR